MRGRRMVAMTRARSHTWAVGISPLIQPLLEAVLCVVMSLVHSVRATFGMRFNRRDRDWHKVETHEALPQTKPDIPCQDPTTLTESLSALCRESLLETPKGLANDPLETLNRESRDKPENDTGEVEAFGPRANAPRLASARRALPTRTIPSTVIPAEARKREELEPRSYARRRQHMPPLGSGSRLRASGMTPFMCAQISPI